MKINDWRNSSDWAVIDTETTGMGKNDQVIEITLMSSNGDVIFNSLIKPSVPIHINALNTHNITMDMLKDSPSWPEIMKDFEKSARLFNTILVYNKSFDVRLIYQTYNAYNLIPPVFNYDCVMMAFSDYLHNINYGNTGKVSLDKACNIVSVDTEVVDRHRSYGDCFLTKELILKTPIIEHNNIKVDLSNDSSSSCFSFSSIIDSAVKKVSSFCEFHLLLLEQGVEIVLTGPNSESKSFNGCLFYRGNQKTSGSKIGKNYTFKKLIERGLEYSENDFEYFYNICLNKIKLEQLNDLTTIGKICPGVIDIYNSSSRPLKTTFKAFLDYFDGNNEVRLIYKTGFLDNLHSQTKMYPDKIATMQLEQIKIISMSDLKFKYKDIYSTKPEEISVIIDKEHKNFIGDSILIRALSVELNEEMIKFVIRCIKGRLNYSSITLNQYIFNQENKQFEKIERMISDIKYIDFSISTHLEKQ